MRLEGSVVVAVGINSKIVSGLLAWLVGKFKVHAFARICMDSVVRGDGDVAHRQRNCRKALIDDGDNSQEINLTSRELWLHLARVVSDDRFSKLIVQFAARGTEHALRYNFVDDGAPAHYSFFCPVSLQ